ncbi:beta-ketoacyl-ACP synthase III [Rhizohabitans arisaemae]|uniref:beta-ketoacyl-ACP synthase III n=1 Tax=Rhizohabitans arisaemae TaxID=2720610 RepID=UPI0024B119D2|nr:beta-ketoacyl-ACP synthase III [Rhizohabitans arisaemae]
MGLSVPPGASGTRIVSMGHYQPANVVTNADLAPSIGIGDEWIRNRVGIAARRIADPGESVVDMATAAASKALAAGGLTPDVIDLVIVATCSSESSMPNAASQVAHALGVPSPGAYDVNAACAGFSYALALASDGVRAGSARHVLVVGAEKMSAWTDGGDRTTGIIFADGAGAAVVGPSARPGIGPVVWGSAGHLGDKITIKDRHSSIRQQGQAVFRWAITSLHPVALEACRRAGVDPSDLAAFVPHQANLRIVEAIAAKIQAGTAVIARDVVESGNTSAASIPLALSRMIERGEVPSGAPALLLGFGAGLTYAAQVVTVP